MFLETESPEIQTGFQLAVQLSDDLELLTLLLQIPSARIITEDIKSQSLDPESPNNRQV